MDQLISNRRRLSFTAGALIALLLVSSYCIPAIVGAISTATPYLAGVAMFITLLAILSTVVRTISSKRKSKSRQNLPADCFTALAVLGVSGYLIAACVQTFQPGGNPADLWSAGAFTAAVFVAIYSGFNYLPALMSNKTTGGRNVDP